MPQHVQVHDFIQWEIEIKRKYPLVGTLTIPDDPTATFPAVLLIAGSGAIDRDGNVVGKRMNFNIYKELAEMITKLGFVTLRYDKRGVGASSGEQLTTGMWDLVADVKANVAYLQAHSRVEREQIILLGHSEGCMLATTLNARYPVAGLVLLAGAAETLAEAIKRQRDLFSAEVQQGSGIKYRLLRLLRADTSAEVKSRKFFAKVMKSRKDVIRQGFVKINAKWLREHFEHDVLSDLSKATCPVLAITGSKDFQTNPESVNRVPGLVQGEAEIHIIPDMDHSLKEYDGEIMVLGYKKQYRREIEQPLHPQLQKILTNWLLSHYQ